MNFLRAKAANLRHKLFRRQGRPLAGCFQPYSYTQADRYPWLFEFARAQLGAHRPLHILSFGCSRGDEVFTLMNYFPQGLFRGLDVNPSNIARCKRRAARQCGAVTFATAADTQKEPGGFYDAIFCLAVLCCGDLTVKRAACSAPRLHFSDFERVVSDLARCVKPGGLLLLHTSNYRFSDTAVAAQFDPILDAAPEQMAPDLLYDRDNRLLEGQRYTAVAFRKRH